LKTERKIEIHFEFLKVVVDVFQSTGHPSVSFIHFVLHQSIKKIYNIIKVEEEEEAE